SATSGSACACPSCSTSADSSRSGVPRCDIAAQLPTTRAMARRVPPIVAVLLAVLVAAAPASALRKASHKGSPAIAGMLLINKFDQDRPLDGRPGSDPFDGTDPSYRCDGDHQNELCFVTSGACDQSEIHVLFCDPSDTPVVSTDPHHNELLGGHGSDVIHAG